MNQAGRTGLTLAAILAAGAAGYWAGSRAIALPPISFSLPWLERTASVPAHADSAAMGPVIYYRDPDGRPVYSATPRKTADGREFVAVHASEDISFEERSEETTGTQIPSSGTPRKVLYYRNPMGLPDTSPTPKKDSMGMDYIPVYAGEDDEDGNTVRIAPGRLQRTGVRTEAVTERVISRKVRAPGTVQPDERNVSVIAVPADSFVSRVENITTGDRVRKGQPLLQLHSNDIAAAAVEVTVNPGEGTRRRLQHYAVPSEVIAEIARTHVIPSAFTWYAPRDGVVLVRNATEGMKMAAGDVLFRIADLSTVWVLTDVPEYALPSVGPSQVAKIRIRNLPGQTFEGTVAMIYPQVNKETRTTKVRIVIPNPDGVLRPDMYADVEIETAAGKPVVAVPDSAVIDTGSSQVVILDRGDGRFEPRDVKVGAQGSGYTEIRDGVASGDRVVVAANFLIDAESNLKAALRGMSAAERAP